MDKGQGRETKNRAIEFYRFLFACVIFILHVRKYGNFESPNGVFNGGYLSVEFFFILSGFFLMQKVQSEESVYLDIPPERQAASYLISKYKKLMPQYWSSLVILLVVDCIVYPGFDIKSAVLKGIPELFALQVFWAPGGLNGQLWFISALIWASALAYYLLLKQRNFMLHVFFPIGLLVSIGYIWENVGHIDITNNSVFFMAPLVRAFFEVGFGCIVYELFRKGKDCQHNGAVLSCLEIGLIGVILAVMWRTRRDYKDFLMIFALGGLVLVVALGQGILSRALNNKISSVLGAASSSVYVNGLWVQRLAEKYCYPKYPFWNVTIVALLITICYSIVVTMLLKRFRFPQSKGFSCKI